MGRPGPQGESEWVSGSRQEPAWINLRVPILLFCQTRSAKSISRPEARPSFFLFFADCLQRQVCFIKFCSSGLSERGALRLPSSPLCKPSISAPTLLTFPFLSISLSLSLPFTSFTALFFPLALVFLCKVTHRSAGLRSRLGRGSHPLSPRHWRPTAPRNKRAESFRAGGFC